jgi:hypothetical protein
MISTSSFSLSLEAYVPFPEPGAPKIMRLTMFFAFPSFLLSCLLNAMPNFLSDDEGYFPNQCFGDHSPTPPFGELYKTHFSKVNANRNQNATHIKAVVYDLESENMNIFRGSPMFDVVRSARVKCVLLLHGLGVGARFLGFGGNLSMA